MRNRSAKGHLAQFNCLNESASASAAAATAAMRNEKRRRVTLKLMRREILTLEAA